ncbi:MULTISPECIES: JAB domain-containing protein [Cyclobacteriaceae]|uniref:RadC family protein n=2 Tax=Cyclobacteriaceae TaxID=563798 RepID=A0ABV9T0G8_9BACT
METSKNLIVSNVAEIELVYKTNVKASERPKIASSKDANTILLENWNSDKIEFVEQFKVMYLNRGNHVIGIVDISTGGIAGTYVDIRVVYAGALKANACAIIVAHNHPSGVLKASEQDKTLTRELKKAGEILKIQLLDHLIVTSEGYFSFRDEGLL